MTCHAHRGAILDLARGLAMPAAVARAAAAHLDGCAACTAELARQREVTRALRELAAASDEVRPGASLEGRLVEMFAARQQSMVRAPEAARATRRWWLAAAAALVLIATGLAAFRVSQRPVVDSGPGESARIEQRTPLPVSAPAAATTTAPPATSLMQTPRRAVGPSRPGQVRSVEFITIPAANGLPALESATIVRLQVQVSELPTYGLAILPDASRSAVEADLLVGQDGQPRAIRLVTAQRESSATRSRQ